VYFKNVMLARNRLAPWGWSKEIETRCSNFKCFNVKTFYVCALVGVLIKCTVCNMLKLGPLPRVQHDMMVHGTAIDQ